MIFLSGLTGRGKCDTIICVTDAGMVKSVDTRDLKSLAVKSVPVRVRLPAPKHSNPNLLPIGETFGFVVFLKDVK